MKVIDLVQLLEEADPDAEVRLMSQSSWPFEYSILGTWTVAPEPDACGECGLTRASHELAAEMDPQPEDIHPFEPYDRDHFEPDGAEAEGVIYIVEGSQLGYGTKAAWEEAERPY